MREIFFVNLVPGYGTITGHEEFSQWSATKHAAPAILQTLE